MANLREIIEIIIKGTDQGASKKISGVNKALGSLGKVAGIAGGAMVAGLGIAGIALAKFAVDATPIPGITKAFEGLTAEIEGGSETMLKALQDQSLGMVTNTDLMKQFNLASQLVGDDFAKKLPDAMGFLSKVASATGEDMGFMMDSLVRGVGRLSPMILDNLGIQVSLSDAYETFADNLGITTDQMTKAQQQTALMDQVMLKLSENTAKMPEVLGSVDQQWGALKTTAQNLKDEIGVALLPSLQSLITAFSRLWAEHGPAVMAFFNDHLVPALGALSGMLLALVNGDMANFREIMATLIPEHIVDFIFDEFIPAVGELAVWLKDNLITAMEDVWGYITAVFGPVFEMLWGKLEDEGPGAIDKLVGFWNDKLLPALEAVWKFLYQDMMPVWEALGVLLEVTVGTALTVIAGIWENVLQPALQAIWSWIQDKIIPIFDKWMEKMGGVKGIIDKIVTVIQNMTDKLKNIKLPSWMIPGSPTPWEVGLTGVFNAMNKVSGSAIPKMDQRMAVMGGPGGPGSLAGAGGATVVLEYKPTISLASEEELQRVLYPFIQRGISEVKRSG